MEKMVLAMDSLLQNLKNNILIENRFDIRGLSYDKMCSYMEALGEKKFRATQLFSWLHQKKTDDFSKMSNIPASLIEKITKDSDIFSVEIEDKLVSKIDGTRKYLHRLSDGNIIETVLLKYEYGNTVCISSQVGCRMGCRFCASTLDGLCRNLTAGEMAGQVYSVEKDIGERVGHIVVMGSGEPLDNYDNFVDFLRIITDEKGANISARSITASTCGIVPQIYRLADEKIPITLALSLHAVTDEKRREIMPIANKYSLNEIFDACTRYFELTGRRITCEYSLISGQNDTDEDAAGLIRIAGRLKCHINLIPVNPIKERSYRATAPKNVVALKNKLEKNRINVTIRREMGRDINGACGQLRRSYIHSDDKSPNKDLGEGNA